jgi:hypothetical protein
MDRSRPVEVEDPKSLLGPTGLPANLTIGEAALHWRTSKHALYSQYGRGQLPGALGRKVGRRILFRREVIDHFDLTGEALNGSSK